MLTMADSSVTMELGMSDISYYPLTLRDILTPPLEDGKEMQPIGKKEYTNRG
jgi:hypothetical protein